MADDAAFLRAILAAPQVDLPRLIYADYLDESGEAERAELIRIQIELFKFGPRPDYCEEQHNLSESPSHWCDLCAWNEKAFPFCRREVILLGKYIPQEHVTNRMAWFQFNNHFDPDERQHGFQPKYSRGFVAEITCLLSNWQNYGPHIMARHPIEFVTLSNLWPIVGRFHDALETISPELRGKLYWFWDPPSPTEIPWPICKLLDGSVSRNEKYYLSEADAHAALSRAAIAWATAEAKHLGLGVYGNDSVLLVPAARAD